jgi:hypothetical protein
MDAIADASMPLQKNFGKKISEKKISGKKTFQKKIFRKKYFLEKNSAIGRFTLMRVVCYWEVHVNESGLLVGGLR